MSHQQLIYQVDLIVDGEVAAPFDLWLAEHIEEMLAVEGFISAEVLADTEGVGEGVVRRSVQYRVRDREALDHYLTHDAERLRAKGQQFFGGYFKASRKVFAAGGQKTADPELQLLKVCRNCQAPLTGQFCNQCGQRDRARMITLWELFRDLIGDLFELDSRLWRSIGPLMLRPGKLTSEYLEGRRVQYTPPLRTYLVVSILFFLVASFGDGESTLNIGGQDVTVSAGIDTDAQQASVEKCDDIEFEIGWERLERPEVLELIRERCRKIAADQGKAFMKSLYDNLPTMIFLFLPLIALVQKVLYLGSGRYYVEHLLFFVHFHSFFFLTLTMTILLARIPDLFPGQGLVTVLSIIALSIYIPVYLFKALRRVYGQGFFVTLIKYLLLITAYFFCLAITMMLGLLYTVLTV